jgi:hypothetical protein
MLVVKSSCIVFDFDLVRKVIHNDLYQINFDYDFYSLKYETDFLRVIMRDGLLHEKKMYNIMTEGTHDQ